ncbi:unnamed protein product, partial [Mycena citricolor]
DIQISRCTWSFVLQRRCGFFDDIFWRTDTHHRRVRTQRMQCKHCRKGGAILSTCTKLSSCILQKNLHSQQDLHSPAPATGRRQARHLRRWNGTSEISTADANGS